MGMTGGGVFLPSDPPPSTGQVLVAPTITSPVISGTTTLATGTTITSPTIAGTATTIAFQVQAVTSAGTTGSDAAAITIGAPGIVTVTGASGAGIGLGTGTVGQCFMIRNINTTGVQQLYAVGATINGTTGTTAVALSPTGTDAAIVGCVVAGAWQVMAISST